MTLAWLNNPTDERVQAALHKTCGICHAKPATPCRHPWETREPLGRVVHLERAQQFLESKARGPKPPACTMHLADECDCHTQTSTTIGWGDHT